MSLESRFDGSNSEEQDALHNLLQEETQGSLIQCLDDGFVRLVDHMGDDAAIVQAARTSYGKGTKKLSEDRGLIRYLMRHWHTTPFEMVEFKFHVRVPMDCWRQWVRHRMASINEYSTRYSEAIDSAQQAESWRLQSSHNKQGSAGLMSEWPSDWEVQSELDDDQNIGLWYVRGPKNGFGDLYSGSKPPTPSEYLSQKEAWLHYESRMAYEERLALGVAREQARKDLPLSTYTEAYWKIDLHNLMHFLRLRIDSHAQEEIRTFANAIGELIRPIVPHTWEAFVDYRLEAMQLSRLEVEVLREVLAGGDWKTTAEKVGVGKRELVEFTGKMDRLGHVLAA